MKLSLRFLSALLLISFMLLAATAETDPVEPRICKTLSNQFTEMCWNSHNCAIICRQFEKFQDGHCEFEGFLRRRCYCTKPCPPDH